jgi:hypothetical protein
MVKIWEPDTKFGIWFEIEAHATDGLVDHDNKASSMRTSLPASIRNQKIMPVRIPRDPIWWISTLASGV